MNRELVQCVVRSMLAVLLATGCGTVLPAPEVQYVGEDTICITVTPSLCRGMRTVCGPVDRTAKLVSTWCEPGTKANVK